VKKKLFIIGGAVVVVLIVIGTLVNSGGGRVEVLAGDVERGTVVSRVSAAGRIFPVTEVKINSQVSARIERLAVREGQQIERGQVLVVLDRTLYQARVEGAEAALTSQRASAEASRATLRQAEDSLSEQKALAEQNLTSDRMLRDAQNSYDATHARYNAALAQVSSAEAVLEQAREDLSRTNIKAPMPGTITALVVEEGEMVLGTQMMMGTQLMAVSDLSRMEVEVDVDETDVVSVEVGQEAEVEVDALPDTLLTGRVTEIANSGTTLGLGTQMEVTNFAVKVELLDSDPRLRPGMSATVDIITETRDEVLYIPIQALTARRYEDLAVSNDREGESEVVKRTTEDEEYVEVIFVVKDDGTVELRRVEPGISGTTYVEIRSGLSEGERVVTGPFRLLSRTLKDGDRVKVTETLLEEKDRGGE
jgi:HlyD family secretion protein